MKIRFIAVTLLLGCAMWSGLSFADQTENDVAVMTAKYEEVAENLQNETSESFSYDSAAAERFYAEQERNLDQVASELDSAYRAGYISEVDYGKAKKSLAETREFIVTEGKNLGSQMADLNQAAAPLMAAHDACQDFGENPQSYQACFQSKLR